MNLFFKLLNGLFLLVFAETVLAETMTVTVENKPNMPQATFIYGAANKQVLNAGQSFTWQNQCKNYPCTVEVQYYDPEAPGPTTCRWQIANDGSYTVSVVRLSGVVYGLCQGGCLVLHSDPAGYCFIR